MKANPGPVPARARRVLIGVETWWGYGRDIIRGIVDHVDRQPADSRWELLYGTTPRLEPATFRHFGRLADAAIVEAWRGDIRTAAGSTGLPTAYLLGGEHESANAAAYVVDDHPAIAEAALRHLRDRGFLHVAFCGNRLNPFSASRGETFARLADEAGLDLSLHEISGNWMRPSNWTRLESSLAAWIENLPLPCGLYTANSHIGRIACAAAARVGVAVPEELAILGSGDDELVCGMSYPPLSAVDHNGRQLGREAASALDDVLAGRREPGVRITVPPRGVVSRQSTDVLAVPHEETAAAIGLIRRRGCERGFDVPALLREVPMGRRTLEGHFRRWLGRTVHEEITRVRIAHARHLLETSDWPLERVAEACGFGYATHLTVSFRKQTGETPAAYRRRRSVE
jgi:LacI family transcriptional regulator